MSWEAYLALALAGAVAGTVNVIAGGGSFLTLPVLIFFGLPPGVANGTNRVGIVLQNVFAVASFDRHGMLDRRLALWAALPALLGAVLGTRMALAIDDRDFQRLLAALMVILSLASLWRPRGAGTSATSRGSARGRLHIATLAAGFFGTGVYAGFVQAGVGFLILAVTTAAGLDLVRGNAVKVLVILITAVLSLAMFAWEGRVDWTMGLALAAGSAAGGVIGARLSVRKGHGWIRAVVTATVILFALQLWLGAARGG